MANGETYAVTLNARVVHPPGTALATNVSFRPSGTYEVAIRTTPDERAEKADRDCRRRTDLSVGTPLEYPEFVVTLNGRELLSVNQEETDANLYPLENPLNAST
jgi:hypothetical protein